jgi:hypothetical protein
MLPAEVGIGKCDVVQTLVIALMVVIPDKSCGLSFEVAEFVLTGPLNGGRSLGIRHLGWAMFPFAQRTPIKKPD